MNDLRELRDALRAFARARDWEQFHSPKNLAMALSAEAGELLEPFLWVSEDASRALPPPTQHAVRDELADVLIYLVLLADELNVDLIDAASLKLAANEARYPADTSRGNSAKYSELSQKKPAN